MSIGVYFRGLYVQMYVSKYTLSSFHILLRYLQCAPLTTRIPFRKRLFSYYLAWFYQVQQIECIIFSGRHRNFSQLSVLIYSRIIGLSFHYSILQVKTLQSVESRDGRTLRGALSFKWHKFANHRIYCPCGISENTSFPYIHCLT